MKQIVILGGGYGGMQLLAKLFAQQLPTDVHITLIDKMPYHTLKTEFYALAAGTISDQHIRVAFPKHPQLSIIYDEVIEIAVAEKVISFKQTTALHYDELVIALGCEDKYHNVPGAAEHTYSIQTIDKSRDTYTTLNNLPSNASVGIVGAGLSGVELASELIESRPDLHITIFDRGPLILSAFPNKLSLFVEKWFNTHNVNIINKASITSVEEKGLFNHDDFLPFDAIVWTAGIKANQLMESLPFEKDAMGRIFVNKYLQPGQEQHVFLIGDCAHSDFAPSAQLAEAHGEQVAMLLQKRWKNESWPETMPTIKLKGILGSLGKKHGFGLVNDKPLVGRVPRLLKSGILWMYKFHKG
ncbi:MAG: NAD(P)/FAD-dependent oxidoreductase [Bacilli bacterium]